jgi:hypothetical protein
MTCIPSRVHIRSGLRCRASSEMKGWGECWPLAEASTVGDRVARATRCTRRGPVRPARRRLCCSKALQEHCRPDCYNRQARPRRRSPTTTWAPAARRDAARSSSRRTMARTGNRTDPSWPAAPVTNIDPSSTMHLNPRRGSGRLAADAGTARVIERVSASHPAEGLGGRRSGGVAFEQSKGRAQRSVR